MKRFQLPILIAAGLGLLLAAAFLLAAPGGGTQAQDQSPLLPEPPFPPTPTVAALADAPAQVASGPQLFAASFDDAAGLAAWEIADLETVPPELGAFWVVRDGRLEQNRTQPFGGNPDTPGDPSTHETAAFTGDASWTDYTVTASFYDQMNATAGLIARRQGGSFYRFRITAEIYPDTPKIVLEKVVDGVATQLAALDGPGYEQRRWYTMALTVSGSRISASLDGQPVLEATDTTLTSGQAGLYTRAMGSMLFDRVSVTAQ